MSDLEGIDDLGGTVFSGGTFFTPLRTMFTKSVINDASYSALRIRLWSSKCKVIVYICHFILEGSCQERIHIGSHVSYKKDFRSQ